jgi:hypothetical protein
VPNRVVLNGTEYLEAVLLVKISGLKIEGIEMNVVATILNGELFGSRKKLLSDSFSSNGLSDPKSADEESIPKCVAQKTCDSRSRFAGSQIPSSLNLASPALDSLNSAKPLKIRSISCADGSQRTSNLTLFMAEVDYGFP